LIGGAGVATAFGLLLLGLKQFNTSKTSGARTAGVVLSGICAVFVAGAIAAGVYVEEAREEVRRGHPNTRR
jgi:hypothetical protein